MTDGLTVESLSVRFGGHLAVDDLSLAAPMGQITGLIGPNGAGKTTTFNACSGLIRVRRGHIRLFGQDVTHARPAQRARLGLGRTFQRVEVCDSMTVRENVLVGCEARSAGMSPLRQFGGAAADRRRISGAVAEAIERCGLADLAGVGVRSLSTGQRRLVELARVLAGGYRFLLLDEPSSGLDDAETQRFAEILRDVVADLGTGVLLVEHDMNLVMGVCDYVHVLDFGHHIFSGDAAATQTSDIVRAAYLGSESVA